MSDRMTLISPRTVLKSRGSRRKLPSPACNEPTKYRTTESTHESVTFIMLDKAKDYLCVKIRNEFSRLAKPPSKTGCLTTVQHLSKIPHSTAFPSRSPCPLRSTANPVVEPLEGEQWAWFLAERTCAMDVVIC